MSSGPSAENDIAVVGFACRFPGASDAGAFWSNLRGGVESIQRFSAEQLVQWGVPAELSSRPDFVPVGAPLIDVELFDHRFWGYSPREAALIDPQQRLFLETTWAAVENAGHDPYSHSGMVGVYAGVGLSTYLLFHLAHNPGVTGAEAQLAMLGNDKDFLSARASYHLNLSGPSIAVQTGCSTSLVATHLACEGLLSYQCDLALAGGASVLPPERTGYLHVPGGTASSDGHCRAFDERGDGTVFGSGVGVVALKRLSDAAADRDTIYAVIKGSAVNNDGANRVGFTAPSVQGQAEVIARAQRVADVDADSINYVEAHGTATKLGDPVEVAALTRAFRQDTERSGFCALGSVKTNVGHLDTAAGAAGLIKTILALHHRQIPPSLYFDSPNPEIDFAASPFFVNTELRDWPQGPHPRRAGVSAFGFGGTNAHLVLEEAPPAPVPAGGAGAHLLVLSAKTSSVLDSMAARLAEHLRARPDQDLADVAHTLRTGRARFEHRATLVCETRDQAVTALGSPGSRRLDVATTEYQRRPVAFLLPGLGDHYPSMGRELYRDEGVFAEAIDRCSRILAEHLGVDLRNLLHDESHPALSPSATLDLRGMLFPAPDDSPLGRTAFAHPALFITEYALAQQWISWGLRPSALLGHSLGEYVAATLAGVFDLDDALLLVARRAQLFEDTPAAGMLAVPWGVNRAREMLSGSLEIALANGPSLTVLAGPLAEIDELEKEMTARGIAVRRLPTRHGFHSSLVESVVAPLTDIVGGMRLSAPRIPFVSNVTGDWITDEAATDPAYWGRHSASPVRFVDGMRALCDGRDHILIEIGPGQSLSSLAAQHLAGASGGAGRPVLHSLPARNDRRVGDRATMLTMLGRAWAAGGQVDWTAVNTAAHPRRVALPSYPFEGSRAWLEPAAAAAEPDRTDQGRTSDRDGWLWTPTWHQLPPSSTGTEPSWVPGQHWLILADELGAAQELESRLATHGQTVTVVHAGSGFTASDDGRYRINPAEAEDYRALCAALARQERSPDHVVHLWHLAGARQDRAATLGFFALELLAAALASHDRRDRHLWVVASGIASVERGDQLEPATALLLGAARCIPQEFDGFAAHCVDVTGAESPGRVAEQLLEVVAEPPPHRLIACRGRRRWVQSFESARMTGQCAPLRPDGVYLLIGGLGRIGLDLAEQLADRPAGPARCRLVFTTRSPFPAAQRWSNWLTEHGPDHRVSRRIRRLRALAERGVEVDVLTADVTDAARMRRALEEIYRRHGALHGVVHAAGMSGPAAFLPITESDRSRSEEVMRARVDGARVLREILPERGLDFVLLVSSNAAVLGGIGISAYAASNIYLDTLAQARADAEDSNRWISVNLEEWALDDGSPPAVTTSFSRYGVSGAEGATCLVRILERAPAGQITLVTGDLQARLDRWIRYPELARSSGVPAAGGGRQPRPALATDLEPPLGELEEAIAELWQEMLGIEVVGRHDSFYDLGGHSLLATQIVTRARVLFDVELSLLGLLAAPTVAGFAEYVRRGLAEGAPDEGTIPAEPRDQPVPLSYAQRRFWFHDQLVPGDAAYNIPDVVRITGPVQADLLERGINGIIARHDSLRTGFVVAAGEPVQAVSSQAKLPLHRIDLTDEPEHVRTGGWAEIAEAEARLPFDLASPPLIRATLLSLSDVEHILLLTMHHIVSDAWSMGVFIRELAESYSRHSGAGGGDPAPLPVQYPDFTAWQRRRLTGSTRDGLVDYWRAQLAGAPATTVFPTDRPRPPEQSFRGALHPIAIPADLLKRLRKVAVAQDCTLFMVLLAGFHCLLHRYTGQRDLVVGSPIAGRSRPELEDLIGVFVNMLPLRATIEPGAPFHDLLAQVRDTTLGAYAHQDLPFELLVEALRPDRNLSHGQVFQNVLVLQNAPLPPLDFADLRIEPIPTPTSTAKFDLMLMLRETPDGATGSIEYATDLFDEQTIARMCEHLLRLLDQIAENPDRSLAELDLMPGDERARVLGEWAHGTPLPPVEESVPELCSRQAAHTPNQVALRDVSGAEMTFDRLERRSNQLAWLLRQRGIGAESRVGVALERTVEAAVVLLAVMKAGGAYLPLDPHYPAEHRRFVTSDSAMDLLLVPDETELPDHHGTETLALDSLWAACDAAPDEPVGHRVRPDDPAYVLYTSGSTGVPKGVVGLHGGMVNRLRWMWRQYPFADAEVGCQKTSLSFLDSFAELFGPLCQGRPVVIVPDSVVGDPSELVSALAEHRVTRLVLVPSLLRLLLDTVPDLTQRLPALRLWVSSGEALPVELAARFHQAAPGRVLLNLYGASEISADITCHEVTREDVRRGLIPIGRPISRTSVYVLDEQMRPVPAGVAGELWVAGAPLARGYLGRPDLTAERFAPDPFAAEPGGLLYRTGDRVRHRPDGTLVYLGRQDQQVKVRGFRVELAEVERAVAAHHTVGQVMVRADGERLVAHCRPADEQTGLDLPGLQMFLRERLPHYMIPTTFVPATDFPLTPSGKVDRSRLAGPGRPVSEAAGEVATDSAARTATAAVVASVWRELLETDGDVGAHDNFFALGGHSLLAARLVVQVRELLRVELALKVFLQNPTVAGLVEALLGDPTHSVDIERRAAILLKVDALSDAEVEQRLSVPRPHPDRSAPPLSVSQQMLWLFERTYPNTAAYNVGSVVRLSGPLHVPHLRRALDAVVQRHDVLRAVFPADDAEPTQRITAHQPLPVSTWDLSTVDPSERQQRAELLASRETAKPFDLAQGPPLRAGLITIDPHQYLFVLTMHHIVGDAWSGEIVLREMVSVYQALATGSAYDLLPLPIQYGDYARWQRSQLGGELFAEQLAYWRTRLADPPPALALPTDRPRPDSPAFRGAEVPFEIPLPVAGALRELCRESRTTVFAGAVATLAVLLHRYTGQTDILIATPVANRGDHQVEPLVGFLVNTVLIRTEITGNQGFADVLRAVSTEVTRALGNQDVPFETVAETLRLPRAEHPSPFFQVMITYRSAPPEVRAGDLSGVHVPVHNGTAKRDLTLHLLERGDTLGGRVEFDTELFDRATAERLAGHYLQLLSALLGETGRPVAHLPMLTEREWLTLAADNAAPVAAPALAGCLHQIFQRQATRTPDAPCVRDETAALTYRQLNRLADRGARRLRAMGVADEAVVGVCTGQSVTQVVALLAVLKAGGAYLPIDPSDPRQRRVALLRDAGAVAVLSADGLEWAGYPGPVVVSERGNAENDDPPCEPAEVPVDPRDAAYLLYTSGSTGRPKGVVVEHRQLLHYVRAVVDRYGVDRPLRHLMLQPLTVDSCLTMLATALCTGGELLLLGRERALDPAWLGRYCREHRPDCLKIAPSHLATLQRAGDLTDVLPRELLVIGGEAADWSWMREIRDLAGDCRTFNHYGPTETTVGVLTLDTEGHEQRRATTALGTPLGGTRAYVLDVNGQPLPAGLPGELYIGGAQVARGYHGRPDLTAAQFVPDPFGREPGGRLYRTGDIVRRSPDGLIEFLGRRDDQIKVRGFRVEPGELESALRGHPDVYQAVAVAREHPAGGPALVGYLVPTDHATFRREAVAEMLRERLPAHLTPAALVVLPELPLTPHGKLNRAALPPVPASEQSPAPPVPAAESRTGQDEDSTATGGTTLERQVAEAWKHLLGRDRVGLDQNFFDIGGHSLMLVQLHQRLRTLAGGDLELITLFRFTTVRSQAALLGGRSTPIPVDPAVRRGRQQSDRMKHRRRRTEGGMW